MNWPSLVLPWRKRLLPWGVSRSVLLKQCLSCWERSRYWLLRPGMPGLIIKNTRSIFHQKAKMIPGELVEQYVGHAPGGVCPFVIPEETQVFLDVSLKRFDIVYPAAGTSNSAVELSIKELEDCSRSREWIDVCKDWEKE